MGKTVITKVTSKKQIAVPLISPLKSLKGILPYSGKPVPFQDMEKAIGTGRKHIRG
jgi:hypothetical protein